MRYRDIPKADKEMLAGLIPQGLAASFRERVGRERRSISEAMTEAICLLEREDPRQYGIEPSVRPRLKAATAD